MGPSRRSATEQAISFAVELDRVLTALGIAADAVQREKLIAHESLLQRWNHKLNLTRICNSREVAERHYGESLFLWSQLQLRECDSVADIGSGGGFPGLPLAAMSPEVDLTLVEPVGKKAVFLKEAGREWPNVAVESCRADELGGSFDWTVVRAVRAPDLLGDLARLAPRTAVLCGENTAKELQSADEFTWEAPVAMPWGDRRYLVLGQRST